MDTKFCHSMSLSELGSEKENGNDKEKVSKRILYIQYIVHTSFMQTLRNSKFWMPIAFFICIFMLLSAEHLMGPSEKLKLIWRNHHELWHKEISTTLRSKSTTTAINKNASYTTEATSDDLNEPVISTLRGTHNNCDKLYVDLGSNIGVQIRKLFEPSKYPNSKILRKYDDILGDVTTRRESVCAFGFEANPRHFERLNQIQNIYNALGWKTTFYNRVVWTENNDTMTIYSDDNSRKEDWGAGVFNWVPNKNAMTTFEVPTVDIASWLESMIDEYSPKTVMGKMDIEGSEYTVIPHLLRRGFFCANKISFMYMEFHKRAANGQDLNKDIFRNQMASQNCASTTLVEVDDETYLHDGMEFPVP